MKRQSKKVLLAGQRSSSFTLILLLFILPGTLALTVAETVPESKAWLISSLLSASYALLSAVALVQVRRIHLTLPQYGWTTSKIFHLMIFISHGVRAVVFGCHIFVLKPKVLTLVLFDLPVLFFFTTYTLLVLYWAGIYNQAKSFPTNNLGLVYSTVNCIFYSIQVCLWLILWIKEYNFIESIGQLCIAVMSFVAAFGFLVYGGRLFFMLQSFPVESRGRRKKLQEVGSLSAVCVTCFLIRGIMVTLSTFVTNASLHVLDHPILCLIYYMLVEIIPSAAVLFVLQPKT